MEAMEFKGAHDGKWVHINAGAGVYASTRWPTQLLLSKEPTFAQFRNDEYQGLSQSDLVMQETFSEEGLPVGYIDIPAKDYYPFFNHARIRDKDRYANDSSMFVSAILKVTGKVDSLLILPDDIITFYEVYQGDELVFSQRITEPTSRSLLPFALIMFRDGIMNYVELSCHGKVPPWLEVHSNVLPVYR